MVGAVGFEPTRDRAPNAVSDLATLRPDGALGEIRTRNGAFRRRVPLPMRLRARSNVLYDGADDRTRTDGVRCLLTGQVQSPLCDVGNDGAHGRHRTDNPPDTNRSLYQTELRVHGAARRIRTADRPDTNGIFFQLNYRSMAPGPRLERGTARSKPAELPITTHPGMWLPIMASNHALDVQNVASCRIDESGSWCRYRGSNPDNHRLKVCCAAARAPSTSGVRPAIRTPRLRVKSPLQFHVCLPDIMVLVRGLEPRSSSV